MKYSPFLRDSIKTTAWSALGKTFGFLIPFLIAVWFGIGSETDAFFLAYGIILFFSGIFAPVLQSMIVPYVTELKVDKKDIGKFIGKILGNISLGILAFLGLSLLVIRNALPMITDFDRCSLDLVCQLLFEISPLVIFLVWTSILAGTLNAYKRFTVPALSPAIRAVVNIIVIFSLKTTFGIHSIVIGYIAGEIARLFVLALTIKKFNLFRFSLSFRLDSNLWEFYKISFFQALGMVAILFNHTVDKIMASWLAQGSVSVLHYADTLQMIPVNLVNTGIMITILSYWSSIHYEAGKQRLKKDVNKAAKTIFLVILPLTLFLILAQKPLVNFVYGRGAFELQRLPEVGMAWVCYLIGFVPYVLGQVYVRGLLVLKNTKVLMHAGFYVIFLNFILNYIMMKFFGVAGIALSTSFSSVFLLFYLARAFHMSLTT